MTHVQGPRTAPPARSAPSPQAPGGLEKVPAPEPGALSSGSSSASTPVVSGAHASPPPAANLAHTPVDASSPLFVNRQRAIPSAIGDPIPTQERGAFVSRALARYDLTALEPTVAAEAVPYPPAHFAQFPEGTFPERLAWRAVQVERDGVPVPVEQHLPPQMRALLAPDREAAVRKQLNCHGTVLFYHGLLPKPVGVDLGNLRGHAPEVFAALMAGHDLELTAQHAAWGVDAEDRIAVQQHPAQLRMRSIAEGEALQRGDALFFLTADAEGKAVGVAHSAVLLNQDFVLHKADFGHGNPLVIERIEDALLPLTHPAFEKILMGAQWGDPEALAEKARRWPYFNQVVLRFYRIEQA